MDRVVETISTRQRHEWWWALGIERRHILRGGEGVADRLAEGLRHAHPDVRSWMAVLLPEVSEARARQEIPALLADPDPDVRIVAARFTVAFDPERTVPVLLALLREPFLIRMEPALDMLISLSRPELPAALAALLPASDWNRRSRILAALAKCGAEGRRILVSLTRHADAETRQYACLTLGDTGHCAEAVDALLQRLEDADPRVRGWGALALGRLGATEAEEALLHALARCVEEDLPDMLRALGCLCFARALPEIQTRIADPRERVRAAAIEAISKYPPTASSESALLACLESETDVSLRKRIVEALGEVGGARAVPLMQRFLDREARALSKRSRKESFRRVPAMIERARSRGELP